MYTRVLLMLGIVLLVFFSFLVVRETPTLTIDGTGIAVVVADTPVARARGLSGKETLAEGTGIWFTFDSADYWGIWMKDMRFPIDILWFDSALHIIHIENNVSPETYPTVFKPSTPARYVLEVPAGTAAKYGWNLGSAAVVQ